jgi:hypothetical protein
MGGSFLDHVPVVSKSPSVGFRDGSFGVGAGLLRDSAEICGRKFPIDQVALASADGRA